MLLPAKIRLDKDKITAKFWIYVLSIFIIARCVISGFPMVFQIVHVQTRAIFLSLFIYIRVYIPIHIQTVYAYVYIYIYIYIHIYIYIYIYIYMNKYTKRGSQRSLIFHGV